MGFADIVTALVPVAALIALGFGLRRTPLFSSADFWAGAEKLAYFVLLPALLFRNVATVDIAAFDLGPLALGLVVPTLGVAGVLCLVHRLVAADAPAFTSVFQGGIRFNTYIGLSLSAALFADTGLALAAIIGAILVPLVNVLSSLAFELFLVDKHSWLSLVRTVVLNPLVLGCVLGIVVNLLPVELPGLALEVLDPLSAAALPVGLLCVGAGMRAISIGEHGVGLVVAAAVKLLVLPAVTVAALLAFGVTGEAARVGLVFQAIATAPSAYVMARQRGGNARLMAALIAVQTLLSMVTLPLVLGLGFRLLG